MAVPTSFYDILPDDFLHLSYMSPLDNFVKTDIKESLGPERTGPALLMRDEVPRSQVPTPIPRTSSISSTISFTSSLDSVSTDSSDLTSDDLDESLPLQRDGHLAPAAMRAAQRRARRPGPLRRRGPNKRRAGTGYSDMMDKLPIDVQEALMVDYPGCCEIVRGKDISTMQKHRFSNRHFNKVPDEFQHLLPSFTCPAFVSLHDKCKSAKAGRYDSTERHCKNCAGFQELFSELTVAPIEITKGEFKAVQEYRKTMKSGQTDDAPPLVEEAIARVLMMLIENVGGDLQHLASLSNLAPQLRAIVAYLGEQRSPSPPPSAQPPTPQPQQGVTGDQHPCADRWDHTGGDNLAQGTHAITDSDEQRSTSPSPWALSPTPPSQQGVTVDQSWFADQFYFATEDNQAVPLAQGGLGTIDPQLRGLVPFYYLPSEDAGRYVGL